MIVALEALFWGSLGTVIYANFGYLIAAWLIARLRPRPVRTGDELPRVTCIIPVFNEADVIADKIQNAVSLAYPEALLQIVVVSDGSTDNTNAILRGVEHPNLECVILPENRGKGIAILAAVERATGDILVITDSDSLLGRDALRALMRPFNDDTIGMVLGQVVVRTERDSSVSAGVSSYWRLEDFLRSLESRSGSTISPSGVLLALRRTLMKELPANCCDDFYLLLSVLSQGYRVVSEPAATAVTILPKEARGEFRRKMRIQARALATFWKFRGALLNPRLGLTFRFVSHKLCRWMVPWALLALLVSNALLAGAEPYRLLFIAQLTVYLVASIAGIAHTFGHRLRGPHLVFYFLLTNVALAVGSVKWLFVGSPATWKR